MPATTITLLVENTAKGRGILAEHGLAYWIATPNQKVLFDTGQGEALTRNADFLGKRLEEAEAIVLSHGHYDHVGALQKALARAPQATVYLHPDALRRRYTGAASGGTRAIDTAFVYGGELQRQASACIYTREPTEVAEGLWVTGEVPRIMDYEDTGGVFYLDAEGHEVDPIRDDQSMYFRCAAGVVLILGCAHAGVVNTMRHVAALTKTDRLHAVIGGMHLLHAGPERLAKTYAAFREFQVEVFAPCHCTGLAAITGFWAEFPGRCVEAHAGKSFTFA